MLTKNKAKIVSLEYIQDELNGVVNVVKKIEILLDKIYYL